MNIKLILFILISFLPAILLSQDSTKYGQTEGSLDNHGMKLPYTICYPNNIRKAPVVLLIAGSGPTNKDGNNFFMTNNHLKLLAEELAENGIASFRYDKRIIPGNNEINEADLRFEDVIEDADFCFKYISEDKIFGKKYILGHSQGSLIGMKTAQNNKINGFISLAGPSEAIGTTIIRQVTAQSEELGEQTAILIDSMLAGFEVKKINPLLFSLFRPSVQPFLKTYMSYDPVEEIKKLKTKILIIQGTTDIQVQEKDAEKLHEATPKSQFKIIDGMNHILKAAPMERNANMKTYTNPDLEVVEELIDIITEFIK